jgi:electron transfer flavoprotein beta subunit
MKILVAIKQVPDRDARLVLDTSRTGVVETDLNWEINESDRYALEAALRMKEARADGSEVVAVTIGPDRARKAIGSALAMGADRGVHLNGPEFQGGDPLCVARTLAALFRQGGFDLALCGTRADDSGYGETPILLAGLLGLPCVFLAIGIETLADGKLRVTRELEAGKQEIADIPLPTVLAVQSGIHEVRYTSLKGIMAAKKKTVEQPTAVELGLSDETIGRSGCRLQVLELAPPVKKSRCEYIEGAAAAMAATLVGKLRADGKL